MNDKNVSELADLIDELMSNGSGHINILTDSENGDINIKTIKSTECSIIKGACAQPTELLDNDD